jgi:hypothetical protein
MSKGGNQIQETPQQRAMVEYAVNQMADYKQRWLPMQQTLARQIQKMGDKDSTMREGASGRSTTDTAMSFERAGGALAKTLANNGANVNSSRSKLATAGLGDDAATTRGLGMTIADQQIDDAYTQSLAALAATGRGERAQVASSLSRQASQSATTSAASAEAAMMNRAGNAELVGTAAGFGLQRAMRPSGAQADRGPMVPPSSLWEP